MWHKITINAACWILIMAILPGTPLSAGYILDDGTPEGGISTFGADMLWLNGFQAVADEETITRVSIMFGANPVSAGKPPNGTNFDLLLYTDPVTNDGNPVDAVRQRQQTEQVANSNTMTFVDYDLDTPITLNVGDWFYVGMFRASPSSQSSVFGPNVDQGDPWASRSHRIGWTSAVAHDLDNLASANTVNSPDTTFDGLNYMIRASGVPVPEPATFTLFALAGVFVVACHLHGLSRHKKSGERWKSGATHRMPLAR